MSKLHGREYDSVAVDAATAKSEVALREETIQAFWAEHDIFHKSITTPAGGEPKGDFVFYDGPPFATGTPHYGHILAGTIKDAIPRFWTMQGYRVRRKWGWDCHGLPLENLIEKKLGLATKRDIETYGVKNFNEAARGAVMEYADEWAKVVPRMGRFADMENDYKTMDSTYTESVWWVFSELNKKGLVFEGFKSMHLCPRCGTTLSNFEVNQGYKDIKDIAVTVKLPLLNEVGNPTDTSLLVWTTTPWTLPGNMAAAVHRDFEYVKVKVIINEESKSEEFLILAKERLPQLGDAAYEVVEIMKGSDLVGRSYQPPFPYWQQQDFEGKANAWKIYHADYVELGEEGTGAVHLAPAYGDEDMQLAKAEGVPIMHHVDGAGHFLPFVTDFAGQLVKPKDDDEAGVDHKAADIEVLKKLQEMGKVVKKENITHSYPHCWRCDTPLLNYATTSWFVNVPKIKDELVAANNTVKWVPDHVGSNRFGRWLEGARDWAVSRQRYWGAPLPIWKNSTTGEYKVFGSRAELLAHTPKRGNQYFIVRHAQAESNLTGVINALPGTHNPLTEAGRAQCKDIADALKDKGITKIVHSGLERARETAERVAAHLGLAPEAVLEDARMIEYQAGSAYEGKTWAEFNANFVGEAEKFTKQVSGAEVRRDIVKRTGDFLYDFDSRHQNETVLVVGHGSSLFGLLCAAEGADMERTIALKEAGYLKNAEIRSLPFTPLPHNDYYELDYHRPYIDDFEMVDSDGVRLTRVPDVFDCWFESGSMPYGQHHYPFSCGEEEFGKEYFPAQFIAEGLDQTRGWFYSLIVLGTALFGKSPYEHVIVNGLVLAEDGKKMSKKLRNYPDPMELADRVGVDAMRYYLLSSPVVRGEDLNFSEKEVLELQRKNIGRLHNVLAMYELYADGTAASAASGNVLDRWIVARLNQLIAESEAGYKAYELDRATRPLADFIDDLSVWYLRRSRDRLKGDDTADKQFTLGTLRHVLQNLALVMAPAMPFYAEYLWQAVKGDGNTMSVHLSAWPKGGEVDKLVLKNMTEVRKIVTLALDLRTKSGVKVRQPLAELSYSSGATLSVDGYLEIIADEVNVKKVSFVGGDHLKSLTEGHPREISEGLPEPTVKLDTTLTPELIAEGNYRELLRSIQQTRKELNLHPAQKIVLKLNDASFEVAQNFEHELRRIAGVNDIQKAPEYFEGNSQHHISHKDGDYEYLYDIIVVP